jgi:hypothetical protein
MATEGPWWIMTDAKFRFAWRMDKGKIAHNRLFTQCARQLATNAGG